MLAEKSGVPASTINNMERGKQKATRLENLLKLAGAFGLSLEELLRGGPHAQPIGNSTDGTTRTRKRRSA